MTSPRVSQKPSASRPRLARLVLRDGVVIEGGFYLNDGQSLAPYLASRKGGWVNIVGAKWAGEPDTHNHAVLQADQVLLAASLDGDIPVHRALAGAVAREVDLLLDDGTRIQGTMMLGDRQRLSDYLFSCGKFMPVLGARRRPGGETLGDIALNALCVKVVRGASLLTPDVEIMEPETEPRPARQSGSFATVTRDVVRRESGSFEVITEGRTPDRRSGASTPHWASVVSAPDATAAQLTPAQRELGERLTRHWLVQLGLKAQLLPPDPRELPPSPTLEQLWHAIAVRNDMADAELAVHVAWSFTLPIASLDDVSPAALHAIPEKVARKLGVLPIRVDGKQLEIAVSDPSSVEIDQQLGFVTKLTPKLSIATPADIRNAIDWHYGPPAAGIQQ